MGYERVTRGVFMKVTTICESLRLPNQALLFDLESLYQTLQTVKDQRARRGIRYPLPAVLMIGLLAKCAVMQRVAANTGLIFLILHNSFALSSPLSDQYVCLQGH